MANELRAGLERGVVNEVAFAHEGREGAAGSPGPKIAGDRRLEFTRSRRRSPKAERLRLAAGARSGKGARLRALERAWLAGQGKGHKCCDIRGQRQDHPAHERVRRESDERSGAQPRDRKRAMRQKARKGLFRTDRRQKQQVKPRQRAYSHARGRAPRSATAPEKPAKKSRRDLRHRRERQKANRHEARFAGHALVSEAERQNADDGDPAHPQHQRADIAFDAGA